MREGSGGRSRKLTEPQFTVKELTSSFAFQAVEELLADLDLDKKSVVIGDSRVRPPLIEPYESSGRKASPVLLWLSQVFMKRGVLQYLEQQRDQQVTGWLVYLQASCRGHVARQKYRKLKVSLCPNI